MENDREQRIRERAYALWEQEGRPEGDDLRFWINALRDLGEDGPDQQILTENTSVLGEPEAKPAPAKTKSKRSASTKGSSISTGEGSVRSAVRHAEGP
jgi:hypothetical protein